VSKVAISGAEVAVWVAWCEMVYKFGVMIFSISLHKII
jgi:hypothetical protein